jgi:hypothetical protein
LRAQKTAKKQKYHRENKSCALTENLISGSQHLFQHCDKSNPDLPVFYSILLNFTVFYTSLAILKKMLFIAHFII